MRGTAAIVRRAILSLVVAFAGLAAPSAARADGDEPWIHISVVEQGPGGATVEVNVPLSLARAALALVPENVGDARGIRIQAGGVSLKDIRRIWAQVRAAGNARFVTVREPDADVVVERSDELVIVRIDERSARGQEVRIRVPVVLVDALLASGGERIDVAGALEQLRTTRGEVLTVEDADARIRIWIDKRSAGGK